MIPEPWGWLVIGIVLVLWYAAATWVRLHPSKSEQKETEYQNWIKKRTGKPWPK